MARKYTNNQVKRAGKILADPNRYTPSDLDFAEQVLTYWRTIHNYPLNTFQVTLRSQISSNKIKFALIAQRTKRQESIVAKLVRYPNMKLSTMQDIAGLRVIVKNIAEVRKIESSYRNSRFHHRLKDSNDYISQPKESGYRGIHLVYEYFKTGNKTFNGLRVEIQIRTKLQHVWATTVETMGTFTNYSLKSSQGPEDFLKYFSLVSAGFSILEGCPVPSDFIGKSDLNIFKDIIHQTEYLNVEENLSAFTVAAEHINQATRQSKYNLITLNLEKRFVNVKSFKSIQLQEANKAYTNIEKQILHGAPIQAVLVSTNSIGNLIKAYPSYFLDSRGFIERLEMIKSLITRKERI